MNASQDYRTETSSESNCPLVFPHHVDKVITGGCTLDLLIYLRKHNSVIYSQIVQEAFADLEDAIYSIISETSHTFEFEAVAAQAWEDWQ
jgi:hypothetical protein